MIYDLGFTIYEFNRKEKGKYAESKKGNEKEVHGQS